MLLSENLPSNTLCIPFLFEKKNAIIRNCKQNATEQKKNF